MAILKKDVAMYSFKELKEELKDISIPDVYSNDEFLALIDLLTKDSRKNIIELGNKFIKSIDKYKKEQERVLSMYGFDKSFGRYEIVAGVDEVGRGPLAGPIVSCAVVLDLNADIDGIILGIKDSKALSKEKREELCEIIKEKALAYSIVSCDNNEIDEKGIGFCNNKIFIDAIRQLSHKPDFILSDGYPIRGMDINNKGIVKGDAKSASIACASIVAKVYRDRLMEEYHEKYPMYYFNENAGYGTVKHVEAIKKYGPCEIHRLSFLKNIL